jgi:large subunit ribosomal protein L15
MVEKKDSKKKAPSKKPVKAAPAKASAKPPRTARPAPARERKGRRERDRAIERPAAAAAAPGEALAPTDAPARPRWTGVQDLRPAFGATRSRKRVGRGPGSGHGKTAGRGHKGQKSRSGYRHQRGFEGGQMPLHRRVPKRGFTNIFRVEYDVVNLSDLERFEAGESVTPERLAELRLAHPRRPEKILGGGELTKALTVTAHKFSGSARTRIEAAGGRCEVIARPGGASPAASSEASPVQP